MTVVRIEQLALSLCSCFQLSLYLAIDHLVFLKLCTLRLKLGRHLCELSLEPLLLGEILIFVLVIDLLGFLEFVQ